MQANFRFSFIFLFLFFQSGILFSQILQPTQPTSGPGSNVYAHGSVNALNYAADEQGFWLFEPSAPVPDSADVVVFLHGLGDVNPMIYGAWIKHLVRKGNIVIYPKYQNNQLTTPDADFNNNAGVAIRKALDTMQMNGHVKPRLENMAAIGHSYGGVLAPNMVILHATYNIPAFKALFDVEGAAIATQVRLPSYTVMPPDIKMLVMVGNDDVIVGSTFGRELMDSTINVSTQYKNHITLFADNTGTPAVTASHSEPLSIDNDYDSGETNWLSSIGASIAKTDAVDYYCFWKLADALLDCAFRNQNCQVAFGDTPEQKFMGKWSDGTDARNLLIEPVSTSVSSIDELKGVIEVYPNPADEQLLIKISTEDENEDVKISIVNAVGISVAETNEKLTDSKNLFRIDVSSLASGIYFVKIAAKSKTGISKIVIQ